MRPVCVPYLMTECAPSVAATAFSVGIASCICVAPHARIVPSGARKLVSRRHRDSGRTPILRRGVMGSLLCVLVFDLVLDLVRIEVDKPWNHPHGVIPVQLKGDGCRILQCCLE